MFDSDSAARYDVEVRLKKVGAGWDDLSAGASKFASVIDGIGSKMAMLGGGAIFAGGAAAIAGITWGVATLGKEAENASISMAAIFNANGISNGLNQGLTMAADTIATMRKDVASLPVEFRDLQNVFKTTAIPLFQAGATRQQAEQFAVKASATGAVMEVDPAMVARESAMLLAGRAGAHNRFGTMLGFSGAKAKELNAADPTKRLAMVTTELDKYSGALALYAHSFQGLETTLIDHGKNFARLATAPVFEEVKNTMQEINDWFAKNQAEVNEWALIIGNDLSWAFRTGKAAILEWWPLIADFASKGLDKLESIWSEIKPGVQSFGAALKDALADPNGTIDKLIHLAELAGGMSLAGHLAGAAGSLGTKSGRVGTGLEIAGLGLAGATVGAGGAGGFAAEAAAAVGGMALVGSALGPLGAAAGAATGALLLVASSYENYASAKAAGEEQDTKAAWAFGQTLYETNAEINRWSAAHGEAETSFHDALEAQASALEATGDAALQAEAGLLRASEAAMEASFALSSMMGSAGDAKANAIGDKATSDYGLGMRGAIQAFLRGDSGDSAKKQAQDGRRPRRHFDPKSRNRRDLESEPEPHRSPGARRACEAFEQPASQ